jgi:hypothetical protein
MWLNSPSFHMSSSYLWQLFKLELPYKNSIAELLIVLYLGKGTYSPWAFFSSCIKLCIAWHHVYYVTRTQLVLTSLYSFFVRII